MDSVYSHTETVNERAKMVRKWCAILMLLAQRPITHWLKHKDHPDDLCHRLGEDLRAEVGEVE
jgi:hypothetical protein